MFMPAQPGRAAKMRLLTNFYKMVCFIRLHTVLRTRPTNLFYTSDTKYRISRKWLNSAFYIQFNLCAMLINPCSL